MRTVDAFLDFCDLVNSQDYHECWSMTWLDTLRNGRSLTFRAWGCTRGWTICRTRSGKSAHDIPGCFRWSSLSSRRGRSRTTIPCCGTTRSHSPSSIFAARHRATAEYFWDLFARDREIAGHWVPLERYINPAFLENRLSGGCGVLADGPDRLLREYAAVLKESDLDPYFPYSPRPPHWWDDENRRWDDTDQNLSVLILGGSSYIVGTGFFANRVE